MCYLKNSLYILKWSKALLAWGILHHKLDLISFSVWYFSLSLFPPSSRIERDPKSMSTCPWDCCLGSRPPTVGPCLQTKVLLHLDPCVHNYRQETRLRAALWASQGWYWHRDVLFLLPNCPHLSPVIRFVHLRDLTAVCEVWLIALPGPVRSVTLDTSHIVSSCPASVPQTGSLLLFPTPTWINSPPQLWIMPTGPFPLSPYSQIQFVIYQHAVLTKEAYLSLSH